MQRALTLAALVAVSLQARAALNVVTCEPEWASLATELGGDKLKVTSTTSALQDPHRIEARPSLIARMRSADLLVCTGMDLEVGWLPVLLQQSANAKLAPGVFVRVRARLEALHVRHVRMGDDESRHDELAAEVDNARICGHGSCARNLRDLTSRDQEGDVDNLKASVIGRDIDGGAGDIKSAAEAAGAVSVNLQSA